MFYWFIRTIVFFAVRIIFQLRVDGREHIPRHGAFIIACNHRSNLDPPIVAAAMWRKLYFLGKKELFKNQSSAWVMHHLNVIPLNREGMDRGALKQGIRALHKSKGLLIFPEGKRSRDGSLGPGRPGLALFAVGAQVPVIPAYIMGSERAMPLHKHYFLPANIRIIFGEPLPAPRHDATIDKKQAYQEFTDRVMQEVADLAKKAA